jgi:hypothetical protein
MQQSHAVPTAAYCDQDALLLNVMIGQECGNSFNYIHINIPDDVIFIEAIL